MNCNIWNLFIYLDYINLVFLCLQGKMGMPGFPGVNGIPVSKYIYHTVVILNFDIWIDKLFLFCFYDYSSCSQ